MSENSNIVIKSGIWYMVSNLLIKASAFLTIPLFSRIMSKAQFGEYSNIASWMTVLTILTGFDAYTTVVRSKHDFEEDIDKYISSVYIMNVVVTLISYFSVVFFWSFFSKIISIDLKYIHIVFLYLLTLPAYNLMMTKQRAFYKYKMFAGMTIFITLVTAIVSIFFVITFDDKLLGRVYGQYIPSIIIFPIIALIILIRGRGVKLSYCLYSLKICLPLVPHLLSLLIIGASDRIMIKNIRGAEMAAIYSIDHNCVQIGNILFDAVNKAWAPWLMDVLHEEKYEEIKKSSTNYFFILEYLIFGVMLVGPEVIYILGGTEYGDAKWALPPLMLGCIFQVAYTMFVNVELYMKKTGIVAVATCTAAIVNIILNAVFIPKYGFVAAAFTSLIGYLILYILHYFNLKHLNMIKVFDQNKLQIGIIGGCISVIFVYFLYNNNVARLSACGLYFLTILFLGIRYKKELKQIIKS